MKQLFLPTLVAISLLFSACTQQPSAPKEPVIDPSLPTVSINGHIESMTSIAFEWKPLGDARVKGYYIYRNDPSSKDAKLNRIAVVEGRFVSHYSDTSLSPNTNYVYRFSSYNEKMQESRASETFRVRTEPLLESVSFFDSIGNLPRMAKLIWRPHDNPLVKGYLIERQTVEKPEWEQIVSIEPRLQAEYIDKNLDDNRVYKYRLRVVTFEGIKSHPSEVVTVSTKPLPMIVENLQASTQKPKQITLVWDANSENDLDYYNIYRATSSNRNYNYYVKLKDTEFTDNVKEDGVNYYYKVTAVDKDGLESLQQGAPAHGSTLAKPQTPSILDVVVKNNSAVLRWKSNDPRTRSFTVLKITKDSWFTWTTQEIKGLTESSYVARNLQPEVQYKFKIMAVDANNIVSEPTAAADVFFSAPAK